MPLYQYLCEKGHSFDRFLALDDYKQPQECECGSKSQKVLTPVRINCDIAPWDAYISPASGKLITSYKERNDDMARTGCVDYDEGVKTDNLKAQKKAEADLDKEVDKTVEMAFDAMPTRKKEKLETELKNSTLEYDRK